ncbi:Oxygen-independent coproporphyrinogen III oxidase [hydrothermal vent metagenome]|uniref:Oxygen-independent coproporphyrinogen III oxidase n=1 Tax=hydrothermal vent metagenome TaxID=652676 RepID=A0A3B0VGC1_9ZZZZ
MNTPLIIPVFIPHQGCPHRCIFCDQRRISGRDRRQPITPREVRAIIHLWLARSRKNRERAVQVAFYGGSFTGLPRPRQQELLAAAAPFLERGEVHSLRLSTRPDYIDAGTVAFLKDYGVSIVELGVQSLDDQVLAAGNRGHSAQQTRDAIRLLRQGGLQVGAQLMTGLPAETSRSLMKTVREMAGLQPDFVRIYPVLVLQGSGLARLYEQGEYRPLSLGAAVIRAAWMKKYFAAYSIPVVRLGLQPGPALENALLAGPYHPAFGEMVNARLMLQRTRRLLAGVKAGCRVTLTIADRDQSVFRGLKSANISRLEQLGLLKKFTLCLDPSQPRQTVTLTPGS